MSSYRPENFSLFLHQPVPSLHIYLNVPKCPFNCNNVPSYFVGESTVFHILKISRQEVQKELHKKTEYLRKDAVAPNKNV